MGTRERSRRLQCRATAGRGSARIRLSEGVGGGRPPPPPVRGGGSESRPPGARCAAAARAARSGRSPTIAAISWLQRKSVRLASPSHPGTRPCPARPNREQRSQAGRVPRCQGKNTDRRVSSGRHRGHRRRAELRRAAYPDRPQPGRGVCCGQKAASPVAAATPRPGPPGVPRCPARRVRHRRHRA